MSAGLSWLSEIFWLPRPLPVERARTPVPHTTQIRLAWGPETAETRDRQRQAQRVAYLGRGLEQRHPMVLALMLEQ